MQNNKIITWRMFATWWLSIAVLFFEVASLIISDQLASVGLAPCLSLPVLVTAFFVRRVDHWVFTALWSAVCMLAAQAIIYLLAVGSQHTLLDTTRSLSTDLSLIGLHVTSELVLAAGIALLSKYVASASYDEAGVLCSIKLESIFGWHTFTFFAALSIYAYLMRSLEVAVSASLLDTTIEVWTRLLSDILVICIFLPAAIGAVLSLVGAPRLEPDIRRIWALALAYSSMVVCLCAAVAIGIIETVSLLIICFSIVTILGLLSSSLQVSGLLLLLNFAGLFFNTQYIAVNATELLITTLTASLGTLVVMLLRLIEQLKLKKAHARADQEEVLKAFVYDGPQYWIVEDKEFKIRLISESAAELIAGKPSAELIGKDALEHICLEDQKQFMAARLEWDERLERGETVVSDTPLTFKRGEDTVKVRVQVKLLHLASGALMRGIIFDDITKVEQARQQAEDYLKAGTGVFLIQNERFETLYVSEKVFDFVSQESVYAINSGDVGKRQASFPRFDKDYWITHRKEIEKLKIGELWESPEPEALVTPSGEDRYIIRRRRWFASNKERLLYTELQDVTDLSRALGIANTFLVSQLTAFSIQNEDFSFYYVSTEFLRLCDVSTAEEIGDPAKGLWENRDEAFIKKNRESLLSLPTGEINEEPTPFVYVQASGKKLSFKVKSKWILNPAGDGRLLITAFEDVTAIEEQRAQLDHLRKTAELYLESGIKAYGIQNENFDYLYLSKAFIDLTGYTVVSMPNHKDFYLDYEQHKAKERRKKLVDTPNGKIVHSAPLQVRTKDGNLLWLSRSARWFNGISGERLLMVSFEDQTALTQEREVTQSLINNSSALIVTQTKDGVIHSVSQAFVDLMGYERDALVGKDLIDFYHPKDQVAGRAGRKKFHEVGQQEIIIERRLIDANNQTKTFILNARASNVSAEYDGILTLSDITALKDAEEKLRHLVDLDELTGIYSRRGMKQRFGSDQRSEDFGLFLIDLDHFKLVNDAYGHDTGDMLLKATANVLESQTRSEGNCFRLGGEEFAVLRPWRGWKDAHDFAENLRELIGAKSVESVGRNVQRTASIGVSYLPESGSMSDALKLADMVLREAKALGRNRSILANESMLETLRSRGMFIQASELQLALERRELEYFVQPIVNASDTNTVGFEALVRWFLPSGKLVEPKEFVDLLYQVIRQPRYAQLKLELRRQVLEQLKDYPECYVSFNFTLEQIGYLGGAHALHRDIQSILDHPNRQIVIELSEKALHARVNEDVLIEELSQLRAFGYKIALDDFGVESSNIQRLQKYPIDIVKIDRSLISEVTTSESTRKMVGSLAVLLKSLELAVTVEGIETQEQAEIINGFGLTIHQGFYYGKPVLPAELARVSQIKLDVPMITTPQS